MTDYSELDALLDRAVQETTGISTATARPSQRQISHRMWDVISKARPRPTLADEESDGHPPAPQCALEAPTGSGKGLAYLAPAVLASCKGDFRSVVSTESIALQTQLVNKDFPAVARAAAALHGREVSVAVHKGWSNYACLLSAASAAGEKLGRAAEVRNRLAGASPQYLAELGKATGDPLLEWVLSQPLTGGDGDKASCDVPDATRRWGEVSVDTSACLGSKCPLYELCLPEQARQRAAMADVIVTNHSLLAVQASKAVPAVIGGAKIGDLDIVIVDEAHALPSQVRSTGATMLSGRTITGIQRALERLAGEDVGAVLQSARIATQLAAAVDTEITALLDGPGEVKIDRGRDPLRATGDAISAWITAARRIIRPYTGSAVVDQMLAGQRAANRVQTLADSVKELREGGLGVARWATPGQDADASGHRWAELHSSPVEVGTMLAEQVWSAPVILEEEDRQDIAYGETPHYQLPVVTCSATMPTTFTREAGLDCEQEAFASPFAAAYDECVLYVPRGLDVPTSRWGGKGKPRLDTKAHPDWAIGHMRTLVEANGGRALVLSATASAGRRYAELLRAHARGRWQVLDTWTMSREIAVATWRSDETAVLVGTRGLMTGVDAAGQTCSLVIIDRIPRAAGNPVDDARLELAAVKVGKWKADSLVYAADAAALLEQAAGRLVRSAGDRGMVAVLDPRLLKGDLAYREETRRQYMAALGHFSRKIAREEQAVAFLGDLRQEDVDVAA